MLFGVSSIGTSFCHIYEIMPRNTAKYLYIRFRINKFNGSDIETRFVFLLMFSDRKFEKKPYTRNAF